MMIEIHATCCSVGQDSLKKGRHSIDDFLNLKLGQFVQSLPIYPMTATRGLNVAACSYSKKLSPRGNVQYLDLEQFCKFITCTCLEILMKGDVWGLTNITTKWCEYTSHWRKTSLKMARSQGCFSGFTTFAFLEKKLPSCLIYYSHVIARNNSRT